MAKSGNPSHLSTLPFLISPSLFSFLYPLLFYHRNRRCGRGNFSQVHKISAAAELQKSLEWSFLRIIGFDSPDLEAPRGNLQVQDIADEKEEQQEEREKRDNEAGLFETRYSKLIGKIDGSHLVVSS